MKTILGTEIPVETRGILYLCNYTYNKEDSTLEVVREILCNSAFETIELYANIPNPESQVATGKTFEDLVKELTSLHKYMTDKKWLEELNDYL